MSLLRRKREAHRVVVHRLGEEDDSQPPSYLVLCDCGWNGPLLPPLTREEALAAGYAHDANVTEEADPVMDEGGWTCFFCGRATGQTQVRLSVGWTENGEDLEQWFAAHRECLTQHAAQSDSIRSGPLFDR